MPYFPLLLAVTLFTSYSLATDQEDSKEEAYRRSSPFLTDLKSESFYKSCQSSCTAKSKGVSVRVELCDDTKVCRGRKQSVDAYASAKCDSWLKSDRAPAVNISSEGKRFKHEPTKASWIACAVFCKLDNGIWYTLRYELGREAFLEDGTWCHNDGKQDYFCQKNFCLPADYDLGQALRTAEADADNDVGNFIRENEEDGSYVVENELRT